MHDNLATLERNLKRVKIQKIDFKKLETVAFQSIVKKASLPGHKVIDADYIVSACNQAVNEIASDEPCATSDDIIRHFVPALFDLDIIAVFFKGGQNTLSVYSEIAPPDKGSAPFYQSSHRAHGMARLTQVTLCSASRQDGRQVHDPQPDEAGKQGGGADSTAR
jgi:hypothetical protein